MAGGEAGGSRHLAGGCRASLTRGRCASRALSCQSAPVVLFSAAIPCQGGEGHRNEQWQSWWAEKFAAEGYRACLAPRRAVWANDDVELWYQQNMVLYLAPSHQHLFPPEPDGMQIDVIHPRLYAIRVIKREKRRARLKRFLPFLK